ncbi:DNA methyltransferase [Vibrio sp. MA40-2]|uniref:DNA methyltransferase n=1 Tax=Vibrio sp. MA40-2 TaxID=3391828 RepID=UPI0039A6C897
MNNYNELVLKLKEIFQIDKPELDFGIYRILNARADEINDYLENKLKAKVQAALSEAGNANKEELEKQLAEAIKGAEALGVDPNDIPKVKDLKNQITQLAQGTNEHESAVFSHLLTFFSRYYDNGDFISKRRYKGDTYAIPYAGEEVMLHWANKDQYYIKSGENFANYSFKLDDGRKVSFKLLAADTAKDNRKDNDEDRRFILIEPHHRTKLDEDGEEYEVEYQPVEVNKTEDAEELVIHFEYKAMKKGTKQDTLVQTAISTVLDSELVQCDWADIAKRAPTEKNPHRTELERHLTTYTQRNTADYFIHKNLGEFLNNELDFYIKNEVMNLDNIQNADVFANVEKQLRMIQCLRSIAQDLITFLAQLENFQKKLWEKKKFVTSVSYHISIDKLDDCFFVEICNNELQWEQWLELGFTDGQDRTVDFIKCNTSLIIDTSLFSDSFQQKVLNSIDDVADNIDGVLINSDNYAALKLIKKSVENKVKNIFIDPPYNTGDDGFLYKDHYKSSSWLSMIEKRFDQGVELLSEDGIIFTSIGDEEQEYLSSLIRQNYGKENLISTLIWEKKKKGSFLSGNVAKMKDYILCTTKEHSKFNGLIGEIATNEETYPCVNASNPRELRVIKPGILSKFRENDYFLAKGSTISAGNMTLVLHSDLVIKDKTLDSELIIEGNWRYSQDNMSKFAATGDLYITQDLYLRRIVREPRYKRMKDLLPRLGNAGEGDFRSYDVNNLSKFGWGTNEDANDELHQLLNTQYAASYPKPAKLLTLLLSSSRHKEGIWLDYFAGSGTTGHAVMNLNRVDGNKRKFYLVEQGEYFNEVLRKRIIKNMFSSDWKQGKAESSDSLSQIIKVVKLESYEDTLNNIALIKREQGKLFSEWDEKIKEDYLINYMLDVESKTSLINIDSFYSPFKYELNISADSAGATERKNIDLVETFNYLLGLHVKTIESNVDRGYVRVEGSLPNGERALVLWRDCDKIGYEELTKYANRFDLYAKEQTFDVIYINGDHNLPTAFTSDDEDGEITRTLKLRQIEPEFLSKMFAEETL